MHRVTYLLLAITLLAPNQSLRTLHRLLNPSRQSSEKAWGDKNEEVSVVTGQEVAKELTRDRGLELRAVLSHELLFAVHTRKVRYNFSYKSLNLMEEYSIEKFRNVTWSYD
jgi:hypothetical protein